MRMNRLWIAILLGACGTEQPTDTSPPDGRPGDTRGYLPLAVGASWVLHETDPQTEESADKTTTVEAYEDVGPSHPGKKAFRVRVEKLRGVTVYWEGVEGGLTVRYRHEDYDLTGGRLEQVVNQPYRLKLDESPQKLAAGTSFTMTYTETTTDAEGTKVKTQSDLWSVVAASETVTVPMGRFDDALHVRRIGNESGTKQKDYWYVRGVGKVKEDGSNRQVEELLSYTPGAPGMALRTIEARLLVISPGGSDQMLAAVRQALEFSATPYTVWTAASSQGALDASVLSDGTRGLFEGVILTGGQPATLTDAEWQALRNYQVEFGVRQASFSFAPTEEQGFAGTKAVDTSRTPIAATLTPAGREVFPYLAGSLTIAGARATLAFAASDRITPLLVDDEGHALIAVTTQADGRQDLALTFDGGPRLSHTLALGHGVLSWVTRGLFIGERHVFANPQVDDVFLGDALFGGGVYRITGDDLRAVAGWQRRAQQRPSARGLVLTLAFNGAGTAGSYQPDTLTPAARELQAEFRWVNHTWSHADLDAADQATASIEIGKNQELARDWQLQSWHPANIVTPGHSGLANPQAMRAARDLGIAYLISNTSRPGQDNPFPNVGIRNALEPELLEIPRHPNEIYFDVTTPAEEVTEYLARHPDRAYGYQQILEHESDRLLGYMLLGDLDPWMFHQSNLRAYDGSHTLLLDLLDRVLEKYDAIYDLPVACLAMEDLGALVAARTELFESGVRGTIVPGESITLEVARDATVPVTGLRTPGAEEYGGQVIAQVRVTAGRPVTIPLR